MEEHIEGWGWDYVGPYHDEHLPNLDNIYYWLETSAFQFAFGYCNPEKETDFFYSSEIEQKMNFLRFQLLLLKIQINSEKTFVGFYAKYWSIICLCQIAQIEYLPVQLLK